MDENRYSAPKSNVETKENAPTVLQNIMKVIFFVAMILLGVFGLLMSGCGLLFISSIGSLFLILGLGISFGAVKGMKMVLSKEKESNERIGAIMVPIVFVALFVLFAIFFL